MLLSMATPIECEQLTKRIVQIPSPQFQSFVVRPGGFQAIKELIMTARQHSPPCFEVFEQLAAKLSASNLYYLMRNRAVFSVLKILTAELNEFAITETLFGRILNDPFKMGGIRPPLSTRFMALLSR